MDGYYWRPAATALEQHIGIKWCEVFFYALGTTPSPICEFRPDVLYLKEQERVMKDRWIASQAHHVCPHIGLYQRVTEKYEAMTKQRRATMVPHPPCHSPS